MLERLGRFARWPLAEQILFAECLILLPAVSAGLRCFGLARMQWFLEALSRAFASRGRARPRGAGREPKPERIAQLVAAAACCSLRRPNCLAQSLALVWLLGRKQVAADLVIGVRKAGARLEAHAWVEQGGTALLDSAEGGARFAAFDRPLLSGPRTGS